MPYSVLAAGAAPPFFVEVATLIVAGAVVAYIGYRLGLVPIVGFLLTGVLIGPNGLGLITDRELVDAAAEVGVILLLFTIGIEFSLEKLARIQRLIFGGGGLQVLLATGVTVAILAGFGVDWRVGVFTGFLVALSSTAIVLKLLGDKGDMNTEPGQVSLGVLIFQDLAIIVMVLLVPMLSGTGGSGLDLAIALGKAAAIIALVLVVARRVMPLVLERVARTCSQELFLLAVIAICFGTAYGTSLAGVSVSLGAFLAGLIVSESRFSEHAFGEIMPLQILFSATFFVSVGMLLDLGFLMENGLLVVGVVAAVLVIKVVTTGISALVLGYRLPVAAASAFLLGQVGEFSFVLERAGREVGLYPAGLEEAGAQTFIAATVLLMIATPFLSQLGLRLAGKMEARREEKRVEDVEPTPLPDEHAALENHIVIAGYGHAARRLVRVLKDSGLPYVVLTLSPPHADEAEAEGLVVVRGHPARAHTLEVARVGAAKALVIADEDAELAHRVIAVARPLNPTMRIVTRARFLSQAEELEEAGADRVIAQEFEAIVQLFADLLRDYGVAGETISEHVERMREGGYVALRETQQTAPVVCDVSGEALDARRILVRPSAAAARETLDALDLERYGVKVLRVHREGETIESPDGGTTLWAGDEVELKGTAEAFAAAATLFRPAGLGTDAAGADVPDAVSVTGHAEESVRSSGEYAAHNGDRARVAVYGADWCPLTSGFRTYLNRHDVPFAYHNVEEDDEAEAAVRAMNDGKLKFPMVVVGDREMKNPTLEELDAALQDAGLLETA